MQSAAEHEQERQSSLPSSVPSPVSCCSVCPQNLSASSAMPPDCKSLQYWSSGVVHQSSL
ncbi:hypothetical protein Fmac_011404 [Flemingia macrophylla]|uniref:Uncharacterized protein n=1 Tax=Flemingia macrophylla TaxID=520843 RepID=A0ABD1MMC0_9FABA